jgi:RHS repeat-associated protein
MLGGRACYTAWGGIAKLHVDEVASPIRLQGQYEDWETGLTSSRYRYFDCTIGHFLSPDPIGLAGGLIPHQYAPNSLGWIDPLGLACGPALKQNMRGQWIDAKGRFARAPDVSNLPSLKGRSVRQVEDILHSRGYTRTNPANPKNQRWVHPDGSEVQIHAYGNATTGPYKASNNAHAHKSLGRHGQPGTTELADNGMTAVSTHSGEAHIGMRNRVDFRFKLKSNF